MAAFAVMACFAVQLAIALMTIPPWQNPDEPQHLMTVRQVMAFGPDFRYDVLEPTVERAIVGSMARYGWWEHYGLTTPVPVPSSFSEGPAHVVGAYFGPPNGGSRLYYRAVALLLELTHIDGLLAQLYTMRLLAAIVGALTVVCIWVGTRTMLDERSALVVTACLALHPQFVLVSTTASPDALVNLCGAAFWWGAAIVSASELSAFGTALMLAASVLAILIRRVGAPLAVVALLVIAERMLSTRRATSHSAIQAVTVISLLIVVAGAVWSWLPADVHRAFEWVQFDPVASFKNINSRINDLPRYMMQVFRSFWLSAGWLRYEAPPWWYDVTIALSLTAAAGIAAARAANRQEQRAIWIALTLFVAQAAAIVVFYFGILGNAAQGRYLFPVLPAILSLLWIGWRRWFPANQQSAATFALIAAFAILNATGWLLVITRAYA